jgi:hypothetical protein
MIMFERYESDKGKVEMRGMMIGQIKEMGKKYGRKERGR